MKMRGVKARKFRCFLAFTKANALEKKTIVEKKKIADLHRSVNGHPTENITGTKGLYKFEPNKYTEHS